MKFKNKTVTGIIAAELGDGGKKTGKNAGLLQGLEKSHKNNLYQQTCNRRHH